jgi:tetratricopeptide (TPR) repeat protein
VYMAQDNNVRAAKDASKAISLLPQDAQAFQCRGLVNMRLEHYDKAIQDFSQSIALDSTVAATYRYRGRVHWLQSNYNQAITDLTKALELKPNYGIAAYFRGCAYFDTGMYREAIPDLERALQLLRASKDAIRDATTRLRKARHAVGAESQATEEPRTSPIQLSATASPAVQKPSLRIEELMKAGRHKNARGEYQLAIDAFSEVIRLNPKNADAYFGRGDAYYGIAFRTNDYRAAMADFREALRLNPDHEDAKRYLQEAQNRHQEPSPALPNSPAIKPSASPSESGISDPVVAKQVARKKAAARWHAEPVEKKSLTEPEHAVFAGREEVVD